MKFLQVDTIEKARHKLFEAAKDYLPATKTVPLDKAGGEVLARDIFAKEDLPHFKRSSVDGYALLSADTKGARESIPVFLTVAGTVEMGCGADFTITSGQCAEIPTGGMLPNGANAVAMVEYCEAFGDNEIAVYKSVAHGSNVMQIGDDCKKGAMLLPEGKKLTPQDIGALAVAGVKEVLVFAPPKICFISTGDELISPYYNPLEPGKIRETNSISLSALAAKYGYCVGETQVLPDNEHIIKQAIKQAAEKYDIVAVSGGSSQGKKDMTEEIINKVSDPGVFTYGIAIKPGKPTILGYDRASKTLLAGLPGHPISAMTVFELLFGWLWRELTGVSESFPIIAKLSANVPQSPGKVTCYPCKLNMENGTYTARPILYKSGLITTLTAADGYFLIDRDTEGLEKGASVSVYLY